MDIIPKSAPGFKEANDTIFSTSDSYIKKKHLYILFMWKQSEWMLESESHVTYVGIIVDEINMYIWKNEFFSFFLSLL